MNYSNLHNPTRPVTPRGVVTGRVVEPVDGRVVTGRVVRGDGWPVDFLGYGEYVKPMGYPVAATRPGGSR